MFVIKLNSGLYFIGEIEGDAVYSSGKRHAVKFEDADELDKVVEKFGIEGYSTCLSY